MESAEPPRIKTRNAPAMVPIRLRSNPARPTSLRLSTLHPTMKFLGKLFTVLGVAMLGVGALAQTENTVVNAIRSVTEQSASLQVVVSEIKRSNIPTRGPEIASGLRDIARSVGSFAGIIRGDTATFSDSAAKEIVDVLTGFVVVHQLLLETIIGKQSLASQFFLTAPIASALSGVEKGVDTLAFFLIDLIPTQRDNAVLQFDALSVTFRDAKEAYSS
ncbi:hypothetical protein C8T65DRAFT_657715 [Cerioporus squamosus]|nr:hypothetical protein C8T65DRAFT_657715 [Cerioporus squamosus]